MNNKATVTVRVLVGAVLVMGAALGIGAHTGASHSAAERAAAVVVSAADTGTLPQDGSGEGPN